MCDRLRNVFFALIAACGVSSVCSADTLDVTSTGVGINDVTPAYDLDVTGEIRATGKIYANDDVIVGDDVILSAALQVQSLAPSGVGCNGGAFLETNDSGTIRCSTNGASSGLSSGGSTTVCWNSDTKKLTTCSSSVRFKSNVKEYKEGIEVVEKLRPVTYKWKDESWGKEREIGLIAEDVAHIDRSFANYKSDGTLDGVKYDRLVTVLINAVKQQQAEIASLQERLAKVDSLETKVNQMQQSLKAFQPSLEVAWKAEGKQ